MGTRYAWSLSGTRESARRRIPPSVPPPDYVGFPNLGAGFPQEGKEGAPKMLSIGLHGRIVGRPGRARALASFLDYVKGKGKDVWICKREEIARHWRAVRPPTGHKHM